MKKNLIKILITFSAILLAGISVWLSLSLFGFGHKPLFIAHRGHGFYGNTQESFYNSKEFYGIECDVRVTLDDKFIICHDDSAVFEGGEKLYIKEQNFEVLVSKKLDNGYKLCSFEKYLQICKELERVAIIELKGNYEEIHLANLVNIIDNNYSREKCKIISFSKSNLLKLKDICDIDLQYLFSGDIDENIEFCIKNKIHASMAYYAIQKQHVRLLHNASLEIGAWTVNDKFSVKSLASLKVDYITSDKFYN